MERVSAGVLALAVCAGLFCAAVSSGPEGRPGHDGYRASNPQITKIVIGEHGRVSAQPSGIVRPAHASLRAPEKASRLAEKGIHVPMMFEPNEGQSPHGVQYIGRGDGLDASLMSDGIDFRVADDRRSNSTAALRIRLRGLSGLVWKGEQPQPGETNYFIGNDRAKWRTRVSHFGRARTDISKGVGLEVYSGSAGFEYDVRVSPRMAATKVRMLLQGARDVRMQKGGVLSMLVGSQKIQMNAPLIYEEATASLSHDAMAASRIEGGAKAALILAGEPISQSTGSRRRSGAKASRQKAGRSGNGVHRGVGRRRGASPAPRRSQKMPEDTEHKRLRKSMHDYPETPHRRKRKRASTGAAKTTPTGTAGSGASRRIRGGYVLEADGSVGIWLGKHDPTKTLVIDPSISVTYDSFLGGTGADVITSVTEDSAGNVYFAGTTNSTLSFPEGANAVFQTERGSSQLFVAKVAFSPSGVGTLEYLSFFGGSGVQMGGQVAVDMSGNAAILGTTTLTDYPVTDGSAPTSGLTGGSANDLVVSEVDPTGANLLYSTLFGGSGAESQNAALGTPLNSSENIPAAQGGIAFDAEGNIYIVSDTTSRDLPTTTGSFESAFGGQSSWDGFVAEFQPDAGGSYPTDILYCSYLGTHSEGAVAIGGVAVDTETPANVYIAGLTTNQFSGFPVRGAFQGSYGGGSSDAFLMAITPSGSGQGDLLYATLLGGTGMDEALAVAVDHSTPPIAYVAGATQSNNFAPDTPVIAGPRTSIYLPSGGHAAAQNAFLAAVSWNPATQMTSLNYFTYLGGSQADAAEAIVPVSQQAVYVTGTATSWDFGWHDNIQAFNGLSDAFVVKLDPMVGGSASLIYATPFGGTFATPGTPVNSIGNGLAVDLSGHVYLGGATTASDFPTAIASGAFVNGFQPICGSCQASPLQTDAIMVALQEGAAKLPSIAFNSGMVNFGTVGVPVGTQAVPQDFAIYNLGESPLHISGIPTVSGPNGADFSVSLAANCFPAIPAGGFCSAAANFTPSAAGLEGGIVNFSDDAPGSPQYLEVTGTGAGPLTMTPASFVFGAVPVNGTSSPYVVTMVAGSLPIQNFTFTQGSNFLGFLPALANSANFPDCHTVGVLAADSGCVIAYEFSPASTGNFQNELTVTYKVAGQSGTSTQSLPLTGTGTATGPLASVRPGGLTFSTQTAGTGSAPQTIFVVNMGSAPMGFSQAAQITGPNASEFSQTNNCGASLAPDSNCTISVAFSPQSAGTKTATLLVTDNASGSPQGVLLNGTALPAPVPQVQVVPTSWNFYAQGIGSSTQQTVTITNTGQGLLSFTQAIAINGPNSRDFSEASNCPSQGGLGPGASCAIAVTFAPIEAGNLAATLNIANNASGGAQSVPLGGIGEQANAMVSPSSPLVFGGQQPGTSSASQALTVISTGPGQPLRVSNISFGGANPADFSEKDNCIGVAITASTPCTIQVTFTPACKNGGARTATLQIQDNSAGSPQNVALSGTATGDFCVIVSQNGSTASVQSGGTANFSPISLVSVTSFSGNVSLTCTSFPTGPGCTTLPSATLPVSPTTVAQFEVQVSTATATTILSATRNGKRTTAGWFVALAAGIFMPWWLRWNRDSRAGRLARAVAVFAILAIGFAACGGSSSDPPAADPLLGVGTYNLTVTAADGTESWPINLTLNVTR